MKRFITDNKVIICIMLVSLVVATTVIGTRFSIEDKNKTYDVVLDYTEIEKMAEQSDHSLEWWFNYFKSLGINKVGLQEESIVTLTNDSWLPVEGQVVGHLMKDIDWQSKIPSTLLTLINEQRTLDKYDLIVYTGNKDATEIVTNGIKARVDQEKYIIYSEGDKAWVWLDGTSDMALFGEKYKYMNSKNKGFIENSDIESSKLMYMSLGFMPEKVKAVQAAGMEIIPRTLCYDGWNDTTYAKAVIAEYEKYGIKPSYIIAGGEAVIGYDDGCEFAKKYIENNNITIGLIENTTQLQNIMQYGVNEIAKDLDYNTVRVFSVWNYIQNRYQYYGYEGAKEIENTLFRAITERNVRVIYFKPFMEYKDWHTYITDPADYEEVFTNLDNRLAEHGFSMGTASVMNNYQPSFIAKIMIAIGAAMGAILALRSILPMKRKMVVALGILAAISVLGAYFVMPNTATLITSFASAVVFACLAVTLFTVSTRKSMDRLSYNSSVLEIIKTSMPILIISALIALCGGIMTAAPLSSTTFMLEIDVFRGVKLAQLLPIAYFAAVFLAYYGYGHEKSDIGKIKLKEIGDLLGMKIKVWMILAVVVVGAVGYYYIVRTGHDSGIEVTSFEMLFRNKLEEVLIARPRTKEFLFAFPAIMIAVYCSIRRLKLLTFVAGMCGVIGMTSVINTFMHIRTPLYLGFMRVGYSLVFGLIAGLIAIVIFDLIYKIYLKHLKKYIDAVNKCTEY